MLQNRGPVDRDLRWSGQLRRYRSKKLTAVEGNEVERRRSVGGSFEIYDVGRQAWFSAPLRLINVEIYFYLEDRQAWAAASSGDIPDPAIFRSARIVLLSWAVALNDVSPAARQ